MFNCGLWTHNHSYTNIVYQLVTTYVQFIMLDYTWEACAILSHRTITYDKNTNTICKLQYVYLLSRKVVLDHRTDLQRLNPDASAYQHALRSKINATPQLFTQDCDLLFRERATNRLARHMCEVLCLGLGQARHCCRSKTPVERKTITSYDL